MTLIAGFIGRRRADIFLDCYTTNLSGLQDMDIVTPTSSIPLFIMDLGCPGMLFDQLLPRDCFPISYLGNTAEPKTVLIGTAAYEEFL